MLLDIRSAPRGFLTGLLAALVAFSALPPVADALTPSQRAVLLLRRPASGVTLDPATAPAGIALSGGNLIATSAQTQAGGVGYVARATVCVTSGQKKAVEFKVATWAFNGVRVGGFLSTFSPAGLTDAFDNMGQNTTSAGVLNNGATANWRNNNGADAVLTPVPANVYNDWIRVEYNCSSSPCVAEVFNNSGVSIGATLWLPTGTVCPGFEFTSTGGTTIEANFGNNPLGGFTDGAGKKWFTGTPTSGFSAL